MCAYLRGVGVVFLEIDTRLLLDAFHLLLGFFLVFRQFLHGEHLIERIGRDVVHIDELHSCLFHHLAIPFSIRIVASFNATVWPLVARSERNEDGRSAFLTRIVNHLFQIPTKRVNHLVGSIVHLVNVQRIFRAGNHTTSFRVGDGADVVVSELNGHKIAWSKRLVNPIPQALADERTRGATRTGGVDEGDFALVEHG